MKIKNIPEPATHLTIGQFAARLNIHAESVRRWLRGGRLKGVKAGSHWRIPLAELERIQMEGGI